tara:strand:- start:718 stop:1488 length:771 start_codon:yes stop_codon:yes gene_type:complete
MMALTQKQIDDFHKKGFIVLKGFFSPDDVAKVSAWLDGLRDKHPAPGEEAMYQETSPINGENILVRIENLCGDYNSQMTELLISDKAQAALAQLIDDEPVLFKDKANFKEHGCRADKLHQDQAAGWNTYCDFFITMAIAIDENRLDNGALSFMSSGNYEKKLMTEEWQPLTNEDPPYQPEDEYTLIEADPGDVVFFDAYVPHGSPPNTGTRGRRNVFLTFNRKSDGNMRERYYRDKWENYAPNKADESRTDETFRV